jgi:asparagine synthase (glutamine-hydrolysing)
VCGICGILGVAADFPAGEALVTAMREQLVHRGPDDAGSWSDPKGQIALGHRRLSIVDLSRAGHQPMTNENGTLWITYNGEVYNHAAIRAELESRGHTYRSRTDTETLLHLYEEEGVDMVKRLHGMFAFGIWDAQKRELFLARDRLGIKPLYYWQSPAGFLFASEIKALLSHPAVGAQLDEEAFLHYLTFICTPAPTTMFRGVRKLAPAERMVVHADGTVKRDRYWSPFSPEMVDEVSRMPEPLLEGRLVELLRESIRKRMMADVPFGVFLSGGVDSSTNVALMSELMDEPVRTFTVAFPGHDRYNELQYARRVAEHFATEHHEVMIGADDLHEFIPRMVYHQDEPIADWVCVPLHFVAVLARETGTIVVQVGEGSDELFHGYDHYISNARFHRRYFQPLQRLPRPARFAIARSARRASRLVGRGQHYSRMLTDAAQGRLPFWGGAVCYRDDVKREILARANGQPDPYDVVERSWREAEGEFPQADLLQKMTYLELKRRLAELLLMRVDKMTMATSVEARVPFLDHQLVEFAMALPPGLKVRNGVGKYVLKKAVAGIIPADIAFRQKQGFGAPVSEWFRGELGARAWAETRESSLADLGLIDYGRLDAMWASHRAGRADWGVHLWVVYNASAWHDYWVAGRAGTD